MALLIGQPLNGRELEQFTSPWSPERFASMCDALAWAASGRECLSLLQSTTRVNAKDGGIDAEWSVEIQDDGRAVPTPILGPGWNVFQYKKRDIIAQDRRRVISSLKSSLRGAASDLVKKDKGGRYPNRYVLFVNVDLKGSDRLAIKKKILEGYPEASNLHVEIVGATEFAYLLNNYPHLRAAYFTPSSFKTWEEAYNAHKRQKLFRVGVELMGREEELDRLRSFVDDPRVRVIVLSGSHDIGKSRLALEATRHRPHDVVLALDPRSLQLSDYRSLGTDRGNVICIVEDPEPDAVELLINESLSSSGLKLIITLPTVANAPAPSYGHDERVQSVHLGPLTEENARKLLRVTGQPLGFEIETWILGQAGGIPGILLAAASVGNSLQSGLGNFARAVAQAFETRIREELGPDALKCARLFSILTHVGILGEVEAELRLICHLFGDGWTPNTALLFLADLDQAGLARRGGSFAEITPPLLANYLVSQLLQGRRDEMFALFGKLSESGCTRFLRRLTEVKGEEVERFWNEVFAPGGLLRNFQTALDHIHLLQLIAGAVPDRTLRVLEQGLLQTTRDERLAIAGNQRRKLMWTLEQLFFRLKTSRRAIRLLWLLAEAENETYGNNATGVLTECLAPRHPQVPLPLYERIELLREFVSEGVSEQGKLFVIQVIKGALDHKEVFHLRHSTGPEPFDSRPIFTYGDLANYCRDLVDILFRLADEKGEVATQALKVLPDATADMGFYARPHETIERFRRLVNWGRSGKNGLDVSSLYGALRLLRDRLSRSFDGPEFPAERRREFEGYIAQVEQLRLELETASFATRLKRWAGKPAYSDYRDGFMSGTSPRFETELVRLANEAARDPSLLNAELVEWLLSPLAQRSEVFFFFLGERDERQIFRKQMEIVGQQPEGARVFSAYWDGWAKRDQKAAEERLEELASSKTVTGDAIVQATAKLGVDQTAVDRMKTQIQTGRVDPQHAGWIILAHRWLEKLTEEPFEQLLQVIAGEAFEHAATVIDMLSNWIYLDRPLQGSLADFAWRCLEQDPPSKAPADPWDFDLLAAKLAQDDPERGFDLLEKLVLKDERNINSHWDPLDGHGDHQFWNALHTKDRKRLIGLLLDAARTDALRQFHISWRLRGLLDQEGDKELLLAFAENVEDARIIADWTTSAKPGFWPIAFGLVQIHPHDATVLSNLTAGLEQQGTWVYGSISQLYRERKQEVEQILQEPSTPPEVRTWLREVISRLEREIPRQIVWDYDMNVEELRQHIRDKGSTQRIWAIGRVLKYAKWEDLRRLLAVEDIEDALPQVDLPEKKRRMLETLVKVWRHGE